jgi:hypothetical protein
LEFLQIWKKNYSVNSPLFSFGEKINKIFSNTVKITKRRRRRRRNKLKSILDQLVNYGNPPKLKGLSSKPP